MAIPSQPSAIGLQLCSKFMECLFPGMLRSKCFILSLHQYHFVCFETSQISTHK